MSKINKPPSDLAGKITKLEAKNSELQDKLTRSLADYINLEKRVERDRDMIVGMALASVIIKMVESLDDFELVQSHLQDQGLKMAIDKFVNVLKNHGVEEINPVGAEFDPATMECAQVVDGPENQVIAVQKKGYSLNGQVIRPSFVNVGKKNN